MRGGAEVMLPEQDCWSPASSVSTAPPLPFRQKRAGSASDRLTEQLALSALEQALMQRRPKPGLLHHSDRGSQYSSRTYRQELAVRGIAVSMSRRGNCWDNAPAESFFTSLKTELFAGEPVPRTRDAARQALFEYIEVFYNRKRRHSALGYLSPVRFEESRRLLDA